MSKPMCKHLFVAGHKKGQICNRFCRSGGELCGEHMSRKCSHDRQKSTCKECGGSQICEHKKHKSQCKECGGSQRCPHNRIRSNCKECGGSQRCPHDKQKSHCKECGGSQICPHDKQKSRCNECGGSQICAHNKEKSRCKECGGSQICEHNKHKSTCKECDSNGYLRHIISGRVKNALKSNKSNKSIEYLGCDITSYKLYIEKQFTHGMTWGNQGEWEIDHILPINFNKPTIKQVMERLHYTNTQPMWRKDNMEKGNRWVGKEYNKDSFYMAKVISDCQKIMEEDESKFQ